MSKVYSVITTDLQYREHLTHCAVDDLRRRGIQYDRMVRMKIPNVAHIDRYGPLVYFLRGEHCIGFYDTVCGDLELYGVPQVWSEYHMYDYEEYRLPILDHYLK